MKALFTCYLRRNGQNEGEDLLLVRDQMEDCYIFSAKEVTVLAKIHTPNFSNVIESKIPSASKLSEFVNPISYSTNQDFLVFAKGNQLNPDQSFQDLGMAEGTHKLLLVPRVKSQKTEGTRWWCPFTEFKTSDYIYESEHSLVFIPNEDIQVVGIGLFRIFSTSATFQKLQLKYKVYDGTNATKIQEGEINSAKIPFDAFPADN
mmetsp:Transcript_955/g.587  ORF Transcript_955/g.587 Transcript_955/m.587 type:complete len:204 (+) Transcript_955:282-893(+)